MGPSLLIRAIYAALQETINGKELVGGRIAHKVNAAGELVVCIIVPPPPTEPRKWRDML
jgi:hypothetical protein